MSRLSALKMEAASLCKTLITLYQTGRRQEALRPHVYEVHVMVELVICRLYKKEKMWYDMLFSYRTFIVLQLSLIVILMPQYIVVYNFNKSTENPYFIYCILH